MRKRAYVSGKITGLLPEQYTSNFSLAENMLIYEHGFHMHEIVNPLKLNHFTDMWLGRMIVDVWHLIWCTHIALQPNWEDSRGARIEKWIACEFFDKDIIELWVRK